MTIQNWFLSRDRALVVSDTLLTRALSNKVCGFTSKAWFVPHLGVMIAAKSWNFPAWSLVLGLHEQRSLLTFDGVIAIAPELMRQAFRHPEADAMLRWSPETRVVVFGWDQSARSIDARVFWARDDFAPLVLPNGWAMTPPIDPPEGDDDWMATAIRQQALDRRLTSEKRDNIGGELLAYEMRAPISDCRPTMASWSLGRLPHCASDEAECRLS